MGFLARSCQMHRCVVFHLIFALLLGFCSFCSFHGQQKRMANEEITAKEKAGKLAYTFPVIRGTAPVANMDVLDNHVMVKSAV